MVTIRTRHRTAIRGAVSRLVDQQRIYMLRETNDNKTNQGWIRVNRADDIMSRLKYAITEECMNILKGSS